LLPCARKHCASLTLTTGQSATRLLSLHRGQAFTSLGGLEVFSGSSIDLSRATSVVVASELSIDSGAWGNLSAITSVGGHMYFAGPQLDDGAHNHVYPNVTTVTSVLFKSINSANGTVTIGNKPRRTPLPDLTKRCVRLLWARLRSQHRRQVWHCGHLHC